MLDIHSSPYAKLDVGEEHSLRNFKLSVSLKMLYGTAFEQMLIKQSRCWNYCIPSDCTSAAENGRKTSAFCFKFSIIGFTVLVEFVIQVKFWLNLSLLNLSWDACY
jgi:hypothetical protein